MTALVGVATAFAAVGGADDGAAGTGAEVEALGDGVAGLGVTRLGATSAPAWPPIFSATAMVEALAGGVDPLPWVSRMPVVRPTARTAAETAPARYGLAVTTRRSC